MTNLQSLEFFIPELILTITILAALITDLFVKKSKTNMIGWVLGVGLVIVGLSVHNLSSVPPTTLFLDMIVICLLYTSPSPRDAHESRMPSSA